MTVARHQGRKFVRADYRCMSLCYPDGAIEKCQGGFIETHILDAAAWQHAIEIIRDPFLVERILMVKEPEEQAIQDLHIIEDNCKKINRKFKSLNTLLELDQQNLDMDEDIIDSILGQLKALAEQKKSWEAQRSSSLQAQERYEKEKEAREKFRRWCKEQQTKLDDSAQEIAYEEKRNALERLGIKAIVWRANHDPRFEISTLLPDSVSTISSHFACKPASTCTSQPAEYPGLCTISR